MPLPDPPAGLSERIGRDLLPKSSADRARASSSLISWRYLDASLLGLLILSITAFNLLWISRDSGRMYVDFARHLGDSVVYMDTFSPSHLLSALETYVYYPPFAYWVTDFFYAALGTTFRVAILSNVFFLSILIVATYGIGKTLWSRRVGLLSALLVVTTPMLVSLFKEYMLDAQLTAMVAAALYFVIRSESFSRRGFSLALGVTCGFGLLTKWTFPFFIALPVVVAAATALRTGVSHRSRGTLTNMVLAGLLTFAISGIWYVHNYSQIRAGFKFNATQAGVLVGDPQVGSLSSVLWYFWNLLNNQLYLIPFLFLLVGVVFSFARDDAASRNLYPIVMIAGTYVAFTLLRNKDFRHTLPMLPAVAVVATSWLENLKPTFRRWLGGGLVAYCLLAFFVISFGTSLLPGRIAIPLKARSATSNLFEFLPPESVTVKGIVVFAQHGFVIGQPSGQRWHQDAIFREIADRGGKSFAYYGEPLETIWFNTWGVRYYGLRYHALWVAPESAQFLIVRGPVVAGSTKGFVQIKEYQLPYDGPVRLYERI